MSQPQSPTHQVVDDNHRRAMMYWREHLAGASGILPLPADFSAPGTSDAHRGTCSMRFSQECRQQAEHLDDNLAVSSSVVLLASFVSLLHRYAGETDVLIGVPLARGQRRPSNGAESGRRVILPLRIDLSAGPKFRTFAKRVRDVVATAYDHQGIFLEDICEQLALAGRLGDSAPVQIVFECDAMFEFALDNKPSAVDPPSDAEAQPFALWINVQSMASGDLLVTANYDNDRFQTETIERLLAHWQVLFASVLQDPDQPIARLNLLTPSERRLVVEDFNATSRPYPRQSTVHELFEAQARQSPQRMAVVEGNQQWTYCELNARANRLAYYLRRAGVGRGVPVAMCLERSWDAVVCLLGILKAGGAYVPLDPNYPAERLAFMVNDVRPTVLITVSRLANHLPTYAGHVLCLDAQHAAIEEESVDNLEPTSCATDLAYIMYTSGSEGVPKGVSVVHRGVVRLVQNVDYLKYGPDEVFLLLAPLSFDASTFEIWGCLLHGGRLVLMPPHPPTLQEIGATLLEQRVTTLWLTTALFHQMVDLRVQDLRLVRQLCTGGDVVSVSHAARVLEQIPSCRLINLYGPTESTTFATSRVITPADVRLPSLPIGGPITNTRAYVLDECLQAAAIGVRGELYLGGDGLALGYWNRPQLTADRFVPDPFATADPTARLYRTGDQARWRNDGTLEFLGRRDRQVKIRGFRIELGEIETALSRHPAVSEAAVLAQPDALGDKQLAAYVAVRPGTAPTVADLRRFLAIRLPAHLIPTAWKLLDSLPQSPVGKLDRRALGHVAMEKKLPAQSYQEPRTHTEIALARIWAEVLGCERVGIHDDFFECGGHSLKAASVSARIRRSLGQDVPLQCLFEQPTIAALAEWLDGHSETASRATLEAIPRAAERSRAPLSCAQQGLWVLEQVTSARGAYNIPLALHVQGPLVAAVLERSLDAIVQRHAVLRTNYRSDGDGLWQELREGSHFTLAQLDLRDTPSQDRDARCRQLLAEQAARPFDLTADLMLRATLIRLREQEYVLLIVVHHIAADGWSIDLLLRELGSLYDCYGAAQMSALPELPLQYADYANWHRELLDRDNLQSQIDYWHEQLAGAPQFTTLPTDNVRPAALTFRGATYRTALPSELVQQLSRFGHEENSTLFMVLLTALEALLFQCTAQQDLVVGTPAAGRTRVELEGLIGFFVNMLALRVDLAGAPTSRELLRRVRQVALAAYAHQDVPFERVVEELRPVRSLAHMPIFQVALAMQYAPRNEWQSEGLKIDQWPVDAGAARYDLTLFVQGEVSGGLEIVAEYCSDLFEQATIARLLEHWQVLLQAMIADPDQSIAHLPAYDGDTSTKIALSETQQQLPDRRPPSVPQTAAEQQLAKICAELLGLPKINVDDDFFELGGTSLLAIRLFAEIERQFGKGISYAAFFRQATVANLARSLEEPAVRADAALVPMQPLGDGCPLFLCYSVGGELFYWQALLRHLGITHPVFGFQPREVNGQPRLHNRIEDVAADCVQDLLSFRPQGPFLPCRVLLWRRRSLRDSPPIARPGPRRRATGDHRHASWLAHSANDA
jgi:amino acid adenylation domain-containing protein